MDLLTALMIFFGMATPDATMDKCTYMDLINNNQQAIQMIYQDPTTLDIMIRNIDRRED